MRKIAIIGCGFSGIMTAAHLVRQTRHPFELVMIDGSSNFGKGVAYNPFSKELLLNVTASRMSAFAADPEHFLDWVMLQDGYNSTDKQTVADSFLPRYLYGEYLTEIWNETVNMAKAKSVSVSMKNCFVHDIDISKTHVSLTLDNNEKLIADYCLLACGNQLPANPKISEERFYYSSRYFHDPWSANAVENADPLLPVLILGNGLTCADTILALQGNGFRNNIVTVSPNGFYLQPNLFPTGADNSILPELNGKTRLIELVSVINRHRKLVVRRGGNPGSVIDGLRPVTQQLWKNLSAEDKRTFLKRLNFLWNAFRHRIPSEVYRKIMQLKQSGGLVQIRGNILNFSEVSNGVCITYFDKSVKSAHKLLVSRVINCTGPATDILMTGNNLLKNGLKKGIFRQDSLKLGLVADAESFKMLDHDDKPYQNLFATGALLRGVLWESTAVKELREQAESIASQLIELI